MSKVHNFLIKIKGADRDQRAAKEKEKDPFGKKEGEKTVVKKALEYAEEAETKKLHLRELRRGECDGETEFKESRKVLIFLSRTRWTTNQNQDGGITWLELYIWYRTHKADEDSKILKPKVSLQSQIANFKKHVRNLKKKCLSQGDEWQLSTCYGRCNRLKQAGIANKHAAVKGLPRIPVEDAAKIMQTIQCMRGSVGTKRNKDAFQKGLLKSKVNSFSYKRLECDWFQRPQGKEDWATSPTHPIDRQKDEKLETLNCPACYHHVNIEKLGIKKWETLLQSQMQSMP